MIRSAPSLDRREKLIEKSPRNGKAVVRKDRTRVYCARRRAKIKHLVARMAASFVCGRLCPMPWKLAKQNGPIRRSVSPLELLFLRKSCSDKTLALPCALVSNRVLFEQKRGALDSRMMLASFLA